MRTRAHRFSWQFDYNMYIRNNYFISREINNFNFKTNPEYYLGKISSDFVGSEYQFYDSGVSPRYT